MITTTKTKRKSIPAPDPNMGKVERALFDLDNDDEYAIADPIIPNLELVPNDEIRGLDFDTTIIKVIPDKYNFDDECRNDFLKGKGIRIRSVESFDKKGNKIYDGLQSPEFGSDYGDEHAFSERYSCECGRYIGKMYEGQICPECGKEVQYNDSDLEKFGWVIIDHFKVITPIFFQKLNKALGTMDGGVPVLEGILRVGFSDQQEVEFTEHDKNNIGDHPFIKKGMNWLSENIMDVLNYYAKRKPNSKDRFDELKKDVDKIFCHCLPIYTSTLRMETPGEKGEKVFKVKTNTLFSSIIRSTNKLNSYEPEDAHNPKLRFKIDRYLWQIESDLASVYDEEFGLLQGKKGFIQAKTFSGRHNYSARNIIIAGSGYLHADEIEISYATFIELFRYELCNLYGKLKGCNAVVANDKWRAAKSHWDEDFYNIMQFMIKDKRNAPYIPLMINRNPSINFGSFLMCKVIRIKRNLNDKTMTVNTRIIKTLNADFDGDQMNIFRIPGANICSLFNKCMNPIYNLYINRLNGRVNPNMLPLKDEVILFWCFNNM